MTNIWSGLRRRLFGTRMRAEDMSQEMRFHIDMETRDLEAAGVPAGEARRRAHVSFGGEDRYQESALDNHRARRMETFARDVRFASRTLIRTPGFSIVAVLTLAIGIGATTSIFTVVNGVLLRPLPYSDPNGLMMVWTTGNNAGGAGLDLPLSAGNYLDLRDRSRTLDIAAFRARFQALADGARTERIDAAAVASNLFEVLGVRPLLGRGFTEDEQLEGANPVVVLSYDLWQSRFGGARDIVGRQIELSGVQHSVVGVMPKGFAFPRGAELPSALNFPRRTMMWTPLIFSAQETRNRGTQNLSVVARMRAQTTVEAVAADVTAAATAMSSDFPPFADPANTFKAVQLARQSSAPVRARLLLLFGVAGIVLLIACANVANLILVRGLSRERELAVRTALGAGTRRIALQVITENVVLSVAAGLLGALFALAGTTLMLRLVPGQLPRADDVTVDLRVLLATFAIAVIAGVVFGLTALLNIDRRRIASSLQSSGARSTATTGQSQARRALITAQIALALVLLVGAALLSISFARVQKIDPGFNGANVVAGELLVPFGPGFNPGRDGPRWTSTFTRVIEALKVQPGVVAIGSTSALPLTGAIETTTFGIDGRPVASGDAPPMAQYAVVTPGYFETMRIELAQGRAFTSADRADAPLVVVINRALADRYFPGENPVGRVINAGLMSRDPRTIVGVAQSVHQTGLDADASPELYMPLSQMPYPYQAIVVRTRGNPAELLPSFRSVLHDVDPSIAWGDLQTMESLTSDSLAERRFSMLLVGIFASAALLLTIVGLYGAVSFAVGQRTREIGVRVALGASQRDVLALVMRDGVVPAAFGVIAGLMAALFLTRLLQSQLFSVQATDPLVYAAVTMLLLVVAICATLVPALRAARVQPVHALKTE